VLPAGTQSALTTHMEGLLQDARYTGRTLLKTPGFTFIVVLTLGLGIGANAAIFSILDQALLRLLPVKHPEELVLLDGPGTDMGRSFNRQVFSYPKYRDFRDKNEVFSGVIGSFPTSATISYKGRAERANAELVTGNYFEVLALGATLGRVLTPDDDRVPDGHPVAVLSYGYWTRRFAADPGVLNQAMVINGQSMRIVGVGPANFRSVSSDSRPDIYVPMMMKAQMTPTWNDLENRRSRWVTVIARLRPGVTRERAEAGMNVLYRQINEQEIREIPNPSPQFAKRFVERRLLVLPGQKGQSYSRDRAATPLLLAMAMVGLVLLIVCANVASLLMARAAGQQREVAIRLALGAARRHIVRQRLVESLTLALLGGAVGILVAGWTGDLLMMLLPPDSGMALSTDPNLRVVLFAFAVAVVTAFVFGLAPALQASRPDVTTALKEETGAVAGGSRHVRFRKVLVIAQVALSVLLLSGAALFARSLYNLKTLDPGFRAQGLLQFSIDPALNGYKQDSTIALFKQVRDDLSALPAVRGVASSVIAALAGSEWQSTVKVEGYKAREDEDMNPAVNAVSPGYFSTMGVPLIEGREFSERDGAGAPRVAVVNETFAQYFFGRKSPIGRRFGFGRDEAPAVEIVGVIKDAKSSSLRDQPKRFVYTPYMQEDELNEMTFYLRTDGSPEQVANLARSALGRRDANMPLYDVRTVEAQLDQSLTSERMIAVLSVAFGLLATLLAAVGLYGVMAYAVARRTREIGIRMALGAQRPVVLGLILREVALLAGIGIVLGLPISLGVLSLVRSQLFGLSAHDPAALTLALLLLGGVALLAGYLPARRASLIDPMRALRTE
jgi:predicted permease